MKKLKQLTLLGLAMIFVLASCDNKTPAVSSSSSTSSSLPSVSVEVSSDFIADWRAEDKEIMLNNLGELIPVAPVSADYVLEEFAEYYGFIITDDTVGDVVELYVPLVENDGYELVDEEAAGNDYRLRYQKENEYGILDMFVGYIQGYFVIDIILAIEDMIFTEWPSEVIDEYYPGVVVPALDGLDYYECYDFFGVLIIYAGPADTSTEAAYIAIFEDAGWELDLTQYEEMGYYASKDGIGVAFWALGGELVIVIAYDTVDGESDVWPAEELATMFEGIPAFPGFDMYLYELDFNFLMATVYAGDSTLEDEATYIAILEADGWVVDGSDYEEAGYVAIKDGICIQFFYEEGMFCIFIYEAY